MMPFYMDSHPSQRNQMPFPPHYYYYPHADGVPPQMTMHQGRPSMMCESWPNGSNYGYPTSCQTCGNHGNFSGYYNFRPPMPPYHWGHYPGFAQQYPVYYPYPPQNWSYEFDKDAQRGFHCCGCPNHTHDQRGDRGVRIEEQEPDTPKQSESLVPVEWRNHPYPMLWIPPEYMKKKYNESKLDDQEIVPHSRKENGNMRSSDSDPKAWNGWFPLDMNTLRSVMQGEDAKKIQNQLQRDDDKMQQFPIFWMPNKKGQEVANEKEEGKMSNGWYPPDANGFKSLTQGDDEKKQNQEKENQMKPFPYPFIWMSPDNSKQGEGEKEDQEMANAPRILAEEPGSKFKVIPVKSAAESVDAVNESKAKKEIGGGQMQSSQTKENAAHLKSIPVKQAEDSKKQADKKSLDSTSAVKNQSSSPRKTSKLPPVCLRLEPLRRKKNGNGNSRSPSPPRSQEAVKDMSTSTSSNAKANSPVEPAVRDASLKKDGMLEPQKSDKKAIDVVDAKTVEKNDELKNVSEKEVTTNFPVSSQEEGSNEFSKEAIGKECDQNKTEEVKGVTCCERDVLTVSTAEAEKTSGSPETTHKTGPRVRELSETEAATLIQSAYRAYEVRKFEPVKKLKQMAAIREQLEEVKNRIQGLESSTSLNEDKERVLIQGLDSSTSLNEDKERVLIGELIMSLLLKLDAIQGLLPSIRDSRKALARELVSMQEKLDTVMVSQPKECSEKDCIIQTRRDIGSRETQNELGTFKNESEVAHDNEKMLKEQEKSRLSQLESVVSEGQEICEKPSLGSEAAQGRCDSEKDLSVTPSESSSHPELVCELQVEGEAPHNEGTEVIMPELKEIETLYPELPRSIELPSISEEKTSSDELVNYTVEGASSDSNDLIDPSREPPEQMLDNVSDLDKNGQVGKEKIEFQGNDDTISELFPVHFTKEDNVKSEAEDVIITEKDGDTNLLTELPLEVVEDDNVPAEEPEQIKQVEVEVPSSEKAWSDMAPETNSPEHEASLNKVNMESAVDDTQILTEELLGEAGAENEETEPIMSTVNDKDTDHPLVEAALTSISTSECEKKEEAEQEEIKEDLTEKKTPQTDEAERTIEDLTMKGHEECPEAECTDKVDEILHDSEDTRLDVIVATPSTPRSIEDFMVERDNKLIEENAKLREMMEKLMEAGKEQLNLISSLTGRVKDLERKLSKKRRLKTRRPKKSPAQTLSENIEI